MQVKQLIEILQTFAPDADIIIRLGDSEERILETHRVHGYYKYSVRHKQVILEPVIFDVDY